MASSPSPTDPVSPPNKQRGRLRLLALAALLGLWLCPWMQVSLETGESPDITGAERTGVAAAAALLALWGLAATTLGARTLRGLRAGSALTEAAVALIATILLVFEHPWIPGGEIREAWSAIFGPLALLAVLDAGVTRFHPDPGREITVIRAGAAFFAAGCLVVDQAWLPAGIALWLAISPLLFLKTNEVRGGRRVIELAILITALAHGFSTTIQERLVGVADQVGAPYLFLWLWGVVVAGVALTALDGLFRPDGEPERV